MIRDVLAKSKYDAINGYIKIIPIKECPVCPICAIQDSNFSERIQACHNFKDWYEDDLGITVLCGVSNLELLLKED